MSKISKKNLLVMTGISVVLLSLPLAVFLVQQRQIIRKKAAEPELRTLTFTESDENFPNPERGWLHRVTLTGDLGDWSGFRNEGITLVSGYARGDDFRDRDLSSEFLNRLQAGFDAVREAGLKVVFRFAYNECGGCPDAPKEIILRHLDQLQPIFEKNADVIAVVEAGFIGAWGEWHSSTHGLDIWSDPDPKHRRDILFKILSVLPKERMVQLRYPPDKLAIFNDQELTEEEAFSGSNLARVGHHNDCFLSNETDHHTYPDEESVEPLKQYLGRESRFIPTGGETCGAEGERAHCPTALYEMALLHWTELNRDYSGDVYEIWEQEGCMNEITLKMGYRFVLETVQAPQMVKPGGILELHFNLKNVGYAPVYNPRPVEIVLENLVTGVKQTARIAQDPRRWSPEANPIEFTTFLRIPANLETGTYRLLLKMPDPYPSLYHRPEYSIRLANQGIWEENTGSNLILNDLVVDPSAPGSSDPNDNEFREIFPEGGPTPTPWSGPTVPPGVLPPPGNIRIETNCPYCQ